ncbi:YciI family protein [Candidatus Saccharibacteria bacterium]|nr:YciI family protein [Candidatus Saccharibacteria bacterium]
MKNYVYLYYNQGTNQAPSEEVAKAWGDWFGKLGDKLVDAGNPFNSGGKAVEKSGVSTIENWPATGYSIVKASSLDEAVEWAKDCPVLEEPKGAVRVYETLPM